MAPTNPYGRSKRMMEDILTDIDASEPGWQVTCAAALFQSRGSAWRGQIGEDPNGIPNNLMPFISQVARPATGTAGVRKRLPTPDGTGCATTFM